MVIHPDLNVTEPAAVIADPYMLKSFLQERQDSPDVWHDEVWEGVYIVAPMPNDEHQGIVGELTTILTVKIAWTGLGKVRPGVNLSDRVEGWDRNYRVPDVVVFLEGTTAQKGKAHWCGGPDFLVEVVSPGDYSREKIPFYSKIGVRELLIIDRDPWALELYRLDGGSLERVGRSTLERPDSLVCQTVPLRFQIQPGPDEKYIRVEETDGDSSWAI